LLNAEIERQTLVDSTVGPDRRMGDRGAVLADSNLAAGLAKTEEKRERVRSAQMHEGNG
jgi:membrane protein